MSKAKKTTKYAVIQCTNLGQLVKQSNELLANGYIVTGGVSVTVDVKNHNTVTYLQSFIYETD